MKYALLLCVLIAFVNSKLPKLGIKSFLESIKSDYDEDQNGPSCRGVESKDACTAISLTDEVDQCCWVTDRSESEPKSVCGNLPKPIKDYKDLLNNKQLNSLHKEIFGFLEKELGEMSSINLDAIVECSDGDFEYKLDIKLTDDEKKIFESENHCLNYTMQTFKDLSKTFDCSKGELLQSSKDAGIECGDLAITLKNGGTESTIKTCMVFPFNLFSKVKMQETLKDNLKRIMTNIPWIPLGESQFTLELSDSKGNKIKYDSETDEITSEGDGGSDDHGDVTPEGDGGSDDHKEVTPDGGSKTDNSIILNSSKYLFLLSLFLF